MLALMSLCALTQLRRLEQQARTQEMHLNQTYSTEIDELRAELSSARAESATRQTFIEDLKNKVESLNQQIRVNQEEKEQLIRQGRDLQRDFTSRVSSLEEEVRYVTHYLFVSVCDGTVVFRSVLFHTTRVSRWRSLLLLGNPNGMSLSSVSLPLDRFDTFEDTWTNRNGSLSVPIKKRSLCVFSWRWGLFLFCLLRLLPLMLL